MLLPKCMSIQTTLEKTAYKSNEIFDLTGLDLKVAMQESKVISTALAQAKPAKAKYVFEQFNGAVHTYILKNGSGSPVKSFTYLANGQQKTLACTSSQTIQVLDFKNTTGTAINGWQVSCEYPEAELAQANLINAVVSKSGNVYTINSTIANARIAVNAKLSTKIIYKVNSTKLAIAHNFILRSGQIKKVEPATKSIFKLDGKWDFNEYQESLRLAPYFFEANESGKRQAGNRVKWRTGDAFTSDGKDVGKDLSGGHFDAGDHLLTAMGEGYCFSDVAMTMHLYKDVYQKTNQWQYYENSLRHACNWLFKICEIKNGELNRFFHWIPLSSNTHNEWLPPEKSRHRRNTYTIDKNNRGSEPVHNTGSCLAHTYLALKNKDKAYADKCLQYSKILFEFGKKYPGKYQSQTVYASSSGYQDERCKHGVSLFAATGDRKYLDDANNTWKNNIGGAYGWFNHLDNSSYVALFLLAKYDGSDVYHNNVNALFRQWSTGVDGIRTIDGVQRCLNDWATTSQSTGMGGLFALYSHHVRKNKAMEDFNRQQLNYVLGNNPQKFSYQIGFGDKWLHSPHHRGSAGSKSMTDEGYNDNVLTGALAGGKKLNGSFPKDGRESRCDWVAAEVALNYQCNLILSVAGAIKSVM